MPRRPPRAPARAAAPAGSSRGRPGGAPSRATRSRACARRSSADARGIRLGLRRPPPHGEGAARLPEVRAEPVGRDPVLRQLHGVSLAARTPTRKQVRPGATSPAYRSSRSTRASGSASAARCPVSTRSGSTPARSRARAATKSGGKSRSRAPATTRVGTSGQRSSGHGSRNGPSVCSMRSPHRLLRHVGAGRRGSRGPRRRSAVGVAPLLRGEGLPGGAGLVGDLPPLATGLPGPRHHRAHEHEQVGGAAVGHERRHEATERLADHREPGTSGGPRGPRRDDLGRRSARSPRAARPRRRTAGRRPRPRARGRAAAGRRGASTRRRRPLRAPGRTSSSRLPPPPP